jgi:MOSC domain-containing protein YiiM
MSFIERFEDTPETGTLAWIGLRPERRAAVASVKTARLDQATGLQGDHFSGKSGRKRQVTLIQAEHLAVVAAFLRRPVPPELLRRNLLVQGINLLSLKGRPFCVGAAVLRATGPCHPCSRMEEALGPGGFQALRGHGGITAEVLKGGIIRVGDPIRPLQRDLFEDGL